MLDTKDIKILKRICEQRKWKNIKELIKELNFTRGDFNYHLQHINFFLKNNKIPQVDVGQYDEKLLQIIAAEFQKLELNLEIIIDSTDRVLILGIWLVICPNLKLEEIKNLLNVSINTSFLDVQNLILYLKNNFNESLKIISTIKGYSYLGDERIIRKFMINIIIQLVNSENYEILKRFIFNHLPFSKFSNDNNFKILEKIILKYYYLLEYIHMEVKTITVIIFVLLQRNQDKITYPKIKEIIEKKNFYEKQKSYQVAKNIINEIETTFNFQFMNKEFEEFYLSILLSSPEQHIVCDNNINEILEIISYLNLLIQKFEQEGYQFNVSALLAHLSKYLNWIRHIWDITLVSDYSANIKKKIFSNNYQYHYFFILLQKFTMDIKIIIKKELTFDKQYDLALQFLPYISKYPVEQSNKIKSILVTNKKGGLINVLILKINELFPNFEIVKIVHWTYFLYHQEKYFDFIKISCSPEIIEFNKSIYLNIENKLFQKNEQNNFNASVFRLLALVLNSQITDCQKIIEINQILKDYL